MAFDIAKARENLARRGRQQQARARTLFEQASADAERIIAMLVEKYRPVRVYQWGSLLAPERFREWSDIDIALEGLSDPLDGLRAMDDAGELTSFPVDIVELERVHPEHARTIRAEGRLVYERAPDPSVAAQQVPRLEPAGRAAHASQESAPRPDD